ncbi:diguanylate cyclase with PAS/PAC sensor [Lachnospiraceae bacterium KM106-2]|nr:diguanylate cyclase with PAS/PAC sensor [Lachnospiraceae bacterium KM106-2]
MEYKDIIKDRLNIFSKFYDLIRIVDPIEKKEYDLVDGVAKEYSGYCYEGLQMELPCVNCISSRAYLLNDTVTKYEYLNGCPVSMMASPIEYEGKRYIVELVKRINPLDIDPSIIMETGIGKIIDEMNHKLMHDELTKIYNRRFWQEQMPFIMNDSFKKHRAISCFMLDIDYFKSVNDTYGHLAGDAVLVHVASILERIVKEENGYVGRYGGEEFYAILLGKKYSQSFLIAEKIRKEIEANPITFEDETIAVTVSLGVADTVEKDVSPRELMSMADQNLYKAKETRNTVV